MYAIIYDPNLHGGVPFEDFETTEELRDLLESNAGRWWHLRDGAVLLSTPEAHVFLGDYDDHDDLDDAYPDFLVTEHEITPV